MLIEVCFPVDLFGYFSLDKKKAVRMTRTAFLNIISLSYCIRIG